MKKPILSIVAGLLMLNAVFGQNWVSFTKTTPVSPIVNLIASDNQSVSFTVEVCGMYQQDLTEGGETFQRISIPGCNALTATGEPELPVFRKLIAIPECTDVTLSVNITGQTAYSNYNIYPVPALQEAEDPYGGIYVEEVFAKDAAAYAQNVYLHGMNAEIVSTGYLRDQKYAEVYLYPVQFNPVTQQLEVYTNYEIILNFTNPSTPVNVNTGIFNNVATHSMLNYVSSGVTASNNDNVQGNGTVQWITLTDPAQADDIVADYLILCAEAFFEPGNPDSEVLQIANHRASYNGFDVAILEADNIISIYYDPENAPYEKERAIRECIRRIYEGANAQHTYDGKLGYVLLIGDSEDQTNLGMPTSYDHPYNWAGSTYPSDYYYTCVTNQAGIYDEVGDLYIGRFCVDNDLGNGLTELHNIVSKTIFYESEATFGGWRNELTAIMYETNPSYNVNYFEFINNIIPDDYTLDEIDEYVLGTGTHDAIFETLNDGVSMIYYLGHGTPNGWSTGGYLDLTELKSNLTNANKPPIAHIYACNSGWFDKAGDCLAEALTTYSEDKGFTGYLGAGRTTGIGYDNPPLIPPADKISGLPYAIYNNLSHITGEYILEMKLITGTSGYAGGYVFNFFGDPALNVMAQGFNVTQDVTLPAFTIISNEITVKDGATLTIPTSGDLHFEAEGKLIIDEGAKLLINDLATIVSTNSSEIIIDGIIALGANITFSSPEHLWDVYINNTNLITNFNHATFEKCRLHNYSKKITIKYSSFDDCFIVYSQRGTVTLRVLLLIVPGCIWKIRRKIIILFR